MDIPRKLSNPAMLCYAGCCSYQNQWQCFQLYQHEQYSLCLRGNNNQRQRRKDLHESHTN